jgi:hypothetical protein
VVSSDSAIGGGVIEGATVSTAFDGNTYSATTGFDGTYSMVVPRYAQTVTVTASAPGYRTADAVKQPITGAEKERNFVHMEAICTVTGKVTSDSGPVEGAAVTIGTETATTDANGDYSVTVTRAESLDVSVTAEGYADYTGTVEAAEASAVKNIVLASAGTPINNADELKDAEVDEIVAVTFDAKAMNDSSDFADNSVYIESGVFEGYKVIIPDGVTVSRGDTFNFTGTVREDADGKYVEASAVTPKSSGGSVRVVGMTNAMLDTNALVRVWGRVLSVSGDSFVISAGGGNVTVKVEKGTAPAVGGFAVVTGIASPNGVRAIEVL